MCFSPENHEDLIKQLRQVCVSHRPCCAVCEKEITKEPLLELPQLPLTEIFTRQVVKEPVGLFDQEFHLCSSCGHGQLRYLIDPKNLYREHYCLRTSLSATASGAADYFLSFINGVFGHESWDNVIDIGCNDLYLLRFFQKKARRLIGVDPVLATVDKKNVNKKFELIGDFVENVDWRIYLKGNKNLILSSHTLEHMADPMKVLKTLMATSSPETFYCIQMPILEPLIENIRFDQIFHQHVNYFSLLSLKYMLKKLNGQFIDSQLNPRHWGTLLVAFRKKRVDHGSQGKWPAIRIKDLSQRLLEKYKLFKSQMAFIQGKLSALREEQVYGYGAALMLPILNYHLSNGLADLKGILDDDLRKEGLYYLNMPVRIIHRKRIKDFRNKVIVLTAVTAVDNMRAILPKVISLRPKEVIVPCTVF